MRRLLKHKGSLVLLALVGAVLAMALWPQPVDVDVARIGRGPLVVTVDEEGRTRVRERFVVSAPVAGRVLRIALEPGDRVARGDVVARIDAGPSPLLDPRSREEAQAAVDSARAALGRARAEEQRLAAALSYAERELERSQRLAESGALPAREVDAREADVRVAREAAAAASFAVRAASAELQRAEARLARPSAASAPVTVVRSPVEGVVLRRLHESETVVPAGEPLVEIADPAQLEIVTDLLSTDAVRVAPGSRAIVERWGGETSLAARVRRVEPSGFTKVSALGVEEQRVNVILELEDSTDEGVTLGDGYRVEVRVVVWEASNVLKVPTSALFREGERWAVYQVRDGRAQRTLLEIGQQTGLEAEVLQGLDEGATVIVHPGDQVRDGVRVSVADM